MGEDGRQVRHLPPRRRPLNPAPPASGHAAAIAALDSHALTTTPFGVYVHVPFCASRCGYCAFVTYTNAELGGDHVRQRYTAGACAEVHLARAALGAADPVVQTVYFGGGTPTELAPGELLRVLAAVRAAFTVAPDLEVTVEANPDSVDAASLDALRAGGVTRVSFGMQSVRSHVLAVLERAHTPGAAADAVRLAHAAGFAHVSLDLMYATPGETDDDWRASLDAAVAAEPDHLSAYALTVEPRTRLAAQVRHGRLPAPDDATAARRYELADDVLTAAGFSWYELSNWARHPAARCRHNLLYWRNHHWWGIGPGAHSHLAGLRWANGADPRAHGAAVDAGELPVASFEVVDPAGREIEAVLLGVRLADGFVLTDPALRRGLEADGLIEERGIPHRVRLSRRGRLLADLVARRVIESQGAARAFIAPVTVP